MKKSSASKAGALPKLLLCAIFVAFVFYPFLQMLLNIKPEDITEIIESPAFKPALKASIECTLTTVFISVPLGFLLAFCVNRSRIPFTAENIDSECEVLMGNERAAGAYQGTLLCSFFKHGKGLLQK